MLNSFLPVIVMGFLNIYCTKIMCILAVVQGQIVWQELLCMEDPHLKCLAKSLFTTVLNSKVPSTTKKYMYMLSTTGGNGPSPLTISTCLQ